MEVAQGSRRFAARGSATRKRQAPGALLITRDVRLGRVRGPYATIEVLA